MQLRALEAEREATPWCTPQVPHSWHALHALHDESMIGPNEGPNQELDIPSPSLASLRDAFWGSSAVLSEFQSSCSVEPLAWP